MYVCSQELFVLNVWLIPFSSHHLVPPSLNQTCDLCVWTGPEAQQHCGKV